MKFDRLPSLLLISYATTLMMSCASNFTIQLVEELDGTVVSDTVILEFLDHELEPIFKEMTNKSGSYVFDKGEIESYSRDSFYIQIKDDRYFDVLQSIVLSTKSKSAEVRISPRITTIRGQVCDYESAMNGEMVWLEGCSVEINPKLQQKRKLPTDTNGEFVIRSNEFSPNTPYQIIISKQDYKSSYASITPSINEINELPNLIFLKPLVILPPDEGEGDAIDIPVNPAPPVDTGPL